MTDKEKQDMRDQIKQTTEMSEALKRLEKNKDFLMVKNQYLYHEPVRLTHLLGDASLNMADKHVQHRKEIEESLIGIARFAAYLRHIHLLAERAKQDEKNLDEADEENKGELIQ